MIGISWSAPGAAWLSRLTQDTISQLGYLELILLVFEGGRSTFLSLLLVLLPTGLSFSLISVAKATPFQAFAAGGALCSTSPATNFTLLSSGGLAKTRLGVVLLSAAMLHDIVGLMVHIISNLGVSSSLSAMTVIRPILVSIAFATLLPVVCVFVVGPGIRSSFLRGRRSNPQWMEPAAYGLQSAFRRPRTALTRFHQWC